MEPASQSAGLIHYERRPSGPNNPPDGPVRVCEKEKVFYPSLSMCWWVSGVVMCLCGHYTHACVHIHIQWNKYEGFHILLEFSTRIASHREASPSTFWLTVIAWKLLNMGEREELSKRKKLGWGRGGGSHSGCNKLFENKEKAVLAVQSHFLAVCVSVNSKPRLLFKERGKKRRGKRGRGGGGGGG